MNPTFSPAASRPVWVRPAIILGLVLVAGLLGWQFLLRQTAVQVTIPAGADRLELYRDTSLGPVSKEVTKSGKQRLAPGGYQVVTYKDGAAVGFSRATVGRVAATITGTVATTEQQFSPVLHQHVDQIQPLQKGYLLLDNVTRSVTYDGPDGAQDISQKLLLDQVDPEDSTFSGSYATVVAMYAVKDNAVAIVTTAAVFLVKSPTDITPLPYSSEAFLNFTSSSYDASTNRLYLLSANMNTIFYYDLGKEEAPQALTTDLQEANRITSGGGKVAVYFDSMPTTESNVLATYAKTRQLAPRIFDGISGKRLGELKTWQGTTQAAISSDGRYIALKKKFAVTLEIHGLDGRPTYTVPASDTDTMIWREGNLYFARGGSLWRINPEQSQDRLALVAANKYPIIRLALTSDELLATTNNYDIFTVTPKDNDISNTIGSQLHKLTLASSDYFIGFTDFGTGAHITVETKGNYITSSSDDTLAASKDEQYRKGLAVLQAFQNKAGISITQKDTSIDTPYESAGTPTDEGGSSGIDQSQDVNPTDTDRWR